MVPQIVGAMDEVFLFLMLYSVPSIFLLQRNASLVDLLVIGNVEKVCHFMYSCIFFFSASGKVFYTV